MENREREEALLIASLFPAITTQMRGMLSGLYLAASALAPAEAREKDPALDRQAAKLDQNYYQLLRLVNSLSAAARLDAQTPPPMADCDLVALTREFCEQAETLAALLKLKMEFRCAVQQIITAADADSLRQLLFQLLSNAFKFTPAGGSVCISLRRSGNAAVLEMADTGCGMDDLQAKTLFEKSRHPETLNPPPHGLGLGLALCRRIVEDHGGVLLAESKLGVGSKFTIQLPVRRSGSTTLSDAHFDYAGGFNRTLLGLADALPVDAFMIRNR